MNEIHYLNNKKIKVEKKLHNLHRGDGEKMKSIGDYQYVYSSNNGIITLTEFFSSPGDRFWQIYCVNGNLFDDIERFSTKEKAEERIIKLLK